MKNGKLIINTCKPVVAIVGRPNVGKSTLFNRLTRTRNAIVDDLPGVTRDRKYGDVSWNDIDFKLIDTGGFFEDSSDDYSLQIRHQIDIAITDADAVILVLDGKHGMSPFDDDLAKILRPLSIPVFFVVNKIDGFGHEERLYDFYKLGKDMLYPISSIHGYGINDFLDDLTAALPKSPSENDIGESVIRLAIVGRPNVGKSSLINRILGEERMIVSDTPGTTRDSVDALCHIGMKSYLLVDTAGIRRKGRVSEKLEKISIIHALKSLDRCDIALIVLDAGEGITDQDIHIAGYAYEKGCGCIFLINKWDIVKDDRKNTKKYLDWIKDKAKFLHFAPVIKISALTGLRIKNIFHQVDTVYAQYTTRIGTGHLNRILKSATEKNEPPLYHGNRLKFFYATQLSQKPPTFICFVNSPEGVHFSYQRYLINQIRKEAGLDNTPLRLLFRKRVSRFKD